MTSTLPPQGWYPDPNQPGLLRWWDGRVWTEQTQPSTAGPLPGVGVGVGGSGSAGGAAEGGASQKVGDFTIPADLPSAPQGSRAGWGRGRGRGGYGYGRSGGNRLSTTAICVEALYLVLAATTGFLLIGILPLFLSIRAISAREKFGPVALAVTIVGFVASFALSGHHH
jgi:Protein of unknown function (DUF2510)